MSTASCPVCRADPGRPCMALDFRALPGFHVERTAETPIYDDLASTR